MKILMFVPSFFPHIGGVEKHSLEISKVLSKQGHRIYIITRKYEKILKNVEKHGKIIIIRIPDKNHFRTWIELFKYKQLFKKCDIIHFHDFITFYWYIPFILINSNLYITFHGFEKYPIPKIYIFLRKIAEIFTKGNICVGKFILKYYKTKPNYITYGGINTNQIVEKSKESSYKLNNALFIGRLELDTGIIEYINALKILKQDYDINLKLDICGDGKLSTYIKGFSKKFNLSVSLNGFKENLDKFYNTAGIIFCSSYLCILESLFKKKFVVSVYQNKLKKNYLFLSPFRKFISIAKSPIDIAHHIVNMREFEKEFYQRSIKGYKFSLNNDWRNLVNLYLKLWKR